MRREPPTAESVVGSIPSDPAAPHFYNPHAILSLPVTIPQVKSFRAQDASPPVLILADGSAYYGDVDVPGRIGTGAVPHGVGIMLFKALNVASTSSPTPASSPSAVSPTVASSGTSDAPPVTIPAPSKSGNYNLEQTCLGFESGDRYGGSWSFGLFEGHGVLMTSTFTYQGNWSAGKMHGKGHIHYSKNFVDRMPGSAGVFEGGVSGLLWRGLSMLSPFEDSAHKPKEYIGDFDRTQLRHGHGLLRYYSGDVYEGQWRANRRHGKGKLTQADGEVYDGEWDTDVRQGYGAITYPDGKQFKGHLQRGERDGEGVLVYANGDEYYGQFVRDTMQGQGTMRYKNGDLYEGEWRDGMRNGKGRYTLKKKKSVVEGNFVNGLIHGSGTVENPGISLFVGSFVRGERSEGTMFFFKGAPGALQHVACYQGEWASERIEGKGLMWLRNGDFYYGTFHRNERSGPGNMRYVTDQSEYSGHFAHNERNGWGIWQRADGFIKAGRWVADAFIEGYEGEWDGHTLNGVGHLRLSFETFVFGPQEAVNACKGVRAASSSATPAESPAEDGGAPATALMPGEAVEFFGLFKHGRREGPGVLRVPAVLAELFPALPVPSFRQGVPRTREPAPTTRRRFFFSSSSAKKAAEAAQAAAEAEALAAARRRRLACGVAEDVHVGEDAVPVCPARHILKGTWRAGVLECDEGVWAFPTGDVYVGPFRAGRRGGRDPRDSAGADASVNDAPAVTWRADGSVHIGPWRNDAPAGDGLYFAKNLRDPHIWTEPAATTPPCADDGGTRAHTHSEEDTRAGEDEEEEDMDDHSVESRRQRAAEKASQTRREASLRAAASTSRRHQPQEASDASSTVGLDVVFNFFSQASSADAMVPVTAAQDSQGASTTSTTAVMSATRAEPPQATPPRRVLMGYGDHYVVESRWEPSCVPEMSYFYGLQQPLFAGPRPVDVNPYSTVMDALGYLPDVALLRHTTAHAGKNSLASSDGASSDGASSSPAQPHTASNRSLTLPSTVSVGRLEGRQTRVWFYGTGVCVASAYRGNHVRLAIPHRATSLFDVKYLQPLQQCGALPVDYRAPSQQTNLAAWLTWYNAAVAAAEKERRKRDVEDALHAAWQHDTRGQDRRGPRTGRPTIKTMDAEARALLEQGPPVIAPAATAVSRCLFCGKEFGLFRRAVPCTLCFRVACSACLGNLELSSASSDPSSDKKGGGSLGGIASASTAREASHSALAGVQSAYATASSAAISPVHAAALESYALLQSALTKASQWKKQKPEDLFEVLTYVPRDLEAYRDALLAQGVTTVPTCVDCVRSLLLKLQVHTIWIPSAMFPNASAAATCWLDEHTTQETGTRGEGVGGGGVIPKAQAEESHRRTAESLEASLPPHEEGGVRTPSSDAAGARDSARLNVQEVNGGDRTPDTSASRAATTADVSPAPAAPSPSASANTSAAPPSSSETAGARVPPAFYVVYAGYTTGQMTPHMYGELWWGHRAYYQGGFSNGLRHGFGTQIFCESGEKYVGEFKRDMWHGFGLFFYTDGSVLQGVFRRNKLVRTLYRGEVDAQWRRHGRGVAYDLESECITEVIANANADGGKAAGSTRTGTSAPASASVLRTSYNGEWVRGERHGTGMYQCFVRQSSVSASDSTVEGGAGTPVVYSGTFVHNAIEGVGKLVTAEGAYYGQFAGNEKHGKGVAFLSDMAIEGHWSKGALHGFCRLFSSENESVYETTFFDGNERDDCFPPPLMVDDAESHACVQCGTTFSMFTRRHHCRLCGHLFCDACSQKRAQLPSHFKISGQVQQRVCDGCFERLGQRRCLALCRYRDGSVYAGCWSHGRWVARGLYCRADGLFILFDNNGARIPGETDKLGQAGPATEAETPLMGSSKGGDTSSSSTTGQKPTSRVAALRDENTLSRTTLATITTSSPLVELDKFILWWAGTVTRCQLHVALDIPMLQRLQALRRTAPELTPALNALARGVRPLTCLTAGTDLVAQLAAGAVQAYMVQSGSGGRRGGGGGSGASSDERSTMVTTRVGADDSPSRGSETSQASRSFFAYPSTPALPEIRLFVPFKAFLDEERERREQQKRQEEPQHGHVPGSRRGRVGDGQREAASSTAVGGDEATRAAAARAALFTPAVAPPMPAYPTPPSSSASSPVSVQAHTHSGRADHANRERKVTRAIPSRALFPLASPKDADAAAHASVRVALPTPPAFSAHDMDDETVLKRIAEARVNTFLPFSPPSATPDGSTVDPAAHAADVASEEARPSMPLLTCYSHKPLLRDTPLPPESGTNTKIAWDDFSTRAAAELIVSATQATAPPSSSSGQRMKSPSANSTTSVEANADLAVLFACPFLTPVVPDVQQVLELGKIRQLAALLQRQGASAPMDVEDASPHDSRAYDGVSDDEDDESKDDVQDEEDGTRLVREAWRARCRIFLNTVPGSSGPAAEQLQSELTASPFADFFVRNFEAQLYASGGAAAKKRQGNRVQQPRAAARADTATDAGHAEGEAAVLAALSGHSDQVGWLPGRLRGPLEITINE